MKLSCLRDKLIKAIGIVSRIVGTKASLPILSNILLTTDKGRLKISTTDLELGIETWIGSKIEKNGSITVPSRLFSEFINSINSEKISLVAHDNKIIISSKENKTLIKGLEANDFPLIPTIKKPLVVITVNSQRLKQALEQTVFSCAVDETKPVLSGILFQLKPKQIVLAATDSYRLAESVITDNTTNKEINFIIPKRTANELARIIEDSKEEVKIKISSNQVSFEYKEIYFISRLIEGTFPDYKQIIPKNFNTSIELDKNQLYQCLKTASLFSRDSANNIKISLKNKLVEINSTSQQLGENHSKLNTIKASGKEVSFSVNALFLLEALSNIQEATIKLEIVDKHSPILLKPQKDSNYFFLIMPLKQE